MNVLVLGGTVFIGLHLVRLLHAQGHTVTVLNRGISEAVLPDGVERLAADRTEPNEVRSALKDASYDVAFDISCYTLEALEPVIASLEGHVGHFIFCSTTSVYAPSEVAPVRDDFPLHRTPDAGDYARNKVVCEDMLMEAFNGRGFPVTVLRPPYVYGPDNKLKQREFSFFARLTQGRTIILPGDGLTLFQSVHVDDLAAAFAATPGRTQTLGQVYTVADSQAITVDGYVRTIGEVMGVSPETVHVEASDFEAMSQQLGITEQDIYPFEWQVSNVYAIEKAMRDLDWTPKYDMRDGLAMTYEWWKAQGLDAEEWDFSLEDRAAGIIGQQATP
jgi:nucleoside-diphosphate-sugar epimerase